MADRHQLLEEVRRRQADEQGAIDRVAPLAVALCYPSPYHVGMSSLGFQAIYRELNRAHPDVSAERVFLPEDVAAWREARLAPVSVERQTPLSRFPVLAFSVAYELELTGLFELLDLAGLPALAADRPQGPLVVAGGPLTFSNPDPLEPFVDVLVQGEAEDLIRPLLDAILAGGGKAAVLERLEGVPGFRVPGRTPESTQQLAMSRFRAVEHGRSTVQVSTVGVSAMIMPDGTVVARTGLFTDEELIASLPLRTTLTFGLLAGVILRGTKASQGWLATRAAAARAERADRTLWNTALRDPRVMNDILVAQGRADALRDEAAPAMRTSMSVRDDGLAALAPWPQATRYY